MTFNIRHLDRLQPYLCAEIPEIMPAKYVQLVIIRQLESHAIFTTEGDDLTTRKVRAGWNTPSVIARLMMTNRKVLATERRLGKETMRGLGIFPETADTCYLGKQCGRCIDCILCGFAAIKGLGNMNSRVLTDEGWSLAERSGFNTDNMTFNAINERTRGTGQALGDSDVILPGTLFINVTTLKGATAHELLYWLYCTHFTRRYGADASRMGKMRNHLVGLVASNVEALSSLELTQRFYDKLKDATDPQLLAEHTDEVVEKALQELKLARHVHLNRVQTEELLTDFLKNYTNEQALISWLTEANRNAATYATKKSKKVKGEETSDVPETDLAIDATDESGDDDGESE